MIRARTVIGVLASAAVFGLLVALPLGQRRQISVELWLGAVATWSVLAMVTRLLAASPVADTPPRPALRLRAAPREEPPRLPRDLLALDGTLLAARENERAFVHRLRPRLRELADHRLRVDHGIDPDREPDRAADALGDSAWLVDPEAVGRTPTADDLDRLLDRLEAPGRWPAQAEPGEEPDRP